jgi:tRNA threonylcarbamoyladenosine biosynthesis protein TsaE
MTEDIGFNIGKMLKAGDIVALYGELGTGKTTMVKGMARAFGIDNRDVTSASFTIIAGYKSDPAFYHIDLYRIETDEDLENTGLWDCIGGDSVSVIEWAEKAEIGLPEKTIKVKIEALDITQREITIDGINEQDRHNLQVR